MKKLYLICLFVIGLLLCFSSCSNNSSNEELVSIDLLNIPNQEKELKLSELVKLVEYVKLETVSGSLFGNSRFVVGKKYIMVIQPYYPDPVQLYLFERSGKFLGKIGKEGKGPEEYVNLHNVIFSADEDYILVHDNNKKVFLEYSISGKMLKRTNYEDIIKGSISSIRFIEDGNLLFLMNRPSFKADNFYLFRIFDKNYNPIEDMFSVNTNDLEAKGWSSGANSFYFKESKIHIREFYYDTLYVKEGDDFKSKYHFLVKNNHVPGYFVAFPKRLTDYNLIRSFSDIGDYFNIVMSTPKNEKSYNFIFDKKSKENFKLTKQKNYDEDNTKSGAIYNDIDGFYNIRLRETPEIYICNNLEIIDLKDYLENEYHLENDVKFPKKRQELVDLINSSSEDDNPILQIFHLK